jgi:hypothetical protein
LVIKEKVVSPDDPYLAEALEKYAALLRKMERNSEAAKVEARANAIRAKHPQESPGN